MKEGALKWALRLLGLALAIGPFLIAFSAHNWDLRSAVLPSEAEINEVRESIIGIIGGGISENPFSWGDPVFTGTTVRIPLQFTSPFSMPITITDFSVKVTDQGIQLAQLNMEEEEVEVPAAGVANFTLVGTYSGTIPSNLEFTDISATLEFYGVTAELQMGGVQGGFT